MIALDANILVYAHRQDSAWHAKAAAALRSLAEGRAAWAIPWPCLHEFYAIATHPRIYNPPSSPAAAVEQIEAWMESPSLVLLAEPESYWSVLKECLNGGLIRGPQVHDARVLSLCRAHGVRELWTADRDFSRFAGLHIRNPLLD